MRRSLLLSVATLAAALLLGCGDQGLTTPEDPASPSFAVERGTIPLFPAVFLDFAGSHTVQFGATFQDLVSSCPGFIPPTQEVDQLTVTRPNGSLLSFTRGKEVNVISAVTVPMYQVSDL